jgi:low affinity Fe/Cu permease
MSGQSQFSRLGRWAARMAGQPTAFLIAVVVVVVWGLTGPLFGFSDTWQLVINTGTTIITFLMVFLIQCSQNRDTVAVQVKLDELIRAIKPAKNTVIDLDHLDDKQLELLLEKYHHLAREARDKMPRVHDNVK